MEIPSQFSNHTTKTIIIFEVQKIHIMLLQLKHLLTPNILRKRNKFWTFTECELIFKIQDYTSLSLNITYFIYYTFRCLIYELTSWNDEFLFICCIFPVIWCSCYIFFLPNNTSFFTIYKIFNCISRFDSFIRIVRSFGKIYWHWPLIPTDETSPLSLL